MTCIWLWFWHVRNQDSFLTDKCAFCVILKCLIDGTTDNNSFHTATYAHNCLFETFDWHNLILFILMTQAIWDDSHAILFKKSSEFKPIGRALSCNFIAWGAVARQLPHITKHREEHRKLKDSLTSPRTCSDEF